MSRRDVHSILFKGSAVDQTFKPQYRPEEQTVRHYPGVHEPELESASDSEAETDTEAPPPQPPQPQSRRLTAIESLRSLGESAPVEIIVYKSNVPAIHPQRESVNEVEDIRNADTVEVGEEDDEEDEDDSSFEGQDDALMLRPTFRTTRLNVDQPSEHYKAEEEERRQTELQRLLTEPTTEDVHATARRNATNGIKSDGLLDQIDTQELPDDTDLEADPEAYLAWKVRELERVKRDRDERLALLHEAQDVERRRNMTDAERVADRAATPSAESARSKYLFLQKYYHKGAFFQDKAQSGEEPLYLRDFNQPVEGDLIAKDSLPAPMRLRRGQFGLAGQVKHTHLSEVDTTDATAWGQVTRKDGGSFDRPSAKKRRLN
ncbi:MAG: uncharacterized protein KVP18_003708 [Porospora cf. gigantea A]|uniref:uncharacterized protein n=1 Tax=Porospora cf. gigantea A TaxID=2853593 RepID=UPI003559A40F|nr:MAG: hypothetical protein KVP18_003708 [Porospora cf. gigantea A]